MKNSSKPLSDKNDSETANDIKAISSIEPSLPSQPSPSSDFEVSQDNLLPSKHAAAPSLSIYETSLKQCTPLSVVVMSYFVVELL